MKREIKTEKKYKKRDIGENSVRKLESELMYVDWVGFGHSNPLPIPIKRFWLG